MSGGATEDDRSGAGASRASAGSAQSIGLAATAKPAIGHGFRLQWEAAQDAHVLLYPEGMVKLNGSAAAILTRCDGIRSIAEIVEDLERSFGATGLTGDVTAFVGIALERGWLEIRV